ncbi:uncharacterized protein BDZ83DRAFT_85559 [Colletotrichum acutatum]|uniref:Uncharacterized protein n=1 Tax=Glomerella acutata TaxID=27357 RepID=A0AAD9CYP6_GLOAC|nr:uncharacterized protein BDZ83DRAFT_85559 [Colletotrichum acutatum]KAK1728872.1 hypothetical protein BDZ83DRAFT_85559 [Colletotrichum acutatum]
MLVKGAAAASASSGEPRPRISTAVSHAAGPPTSKISTPPPARQPVGLFSEVAFSPPPPPGRDPLFTATVGVAARHAIPDLAAAPMQDGGCLYTNVAECQPCDKDTCGKILLYQDIVSKKGGALLAGTSLTTQYPPLGSEKKNGCSTVHSYVC